MTKIINNFSTIFFRQSRFWNKSRDKFFFQPIFIYIYKIFDWFGWDLQGQKWSRSSWAIWVWTSRKINREKKIFWNLGTMKNPSQGTNVKGFYWNTLLQKMVFDWDNDERNQAHEHRELKSICLWRTFQTFGTFWNLLQTMRFQI